MKPGSKLLPILKKVVPPVLTIGTSAVILTGSYAYYQHHREPENSIATVNFPSTLNSVATMRRGDEASGSNSTNNVTNPSRSGQSPSDKPSRNSGKPGKSAKSGGTSSDTQTSPSQGNEGFTPVSGGKVSDIADPNGMITQPFTSLVTQFGVNPVTNFNAQAFKSQFNITLTLDKSLNEPVSQLVAVPLYKGILWALVSPDIIEKNNGTPLYYTPYGLSTNVQQVDLSPKHAQLLGIIPATVADPTKIQTSWYHPGSKPSSPTTNNSSNNNSSNQTSLVGSQAWLTVKSNNSNVTTNSTSNNTNGTGTESNPSLSPSNTTHGSSNFGSATAGQNSTGSTSTQSGSLTNNSAPSNLTGEATSGGNAQLSLHGLYQVNNDSGAVITLFEQSAGSTYTWAYYWNENSESLVPICSIETTSQRRSWLTVGMQTVYWGQRTLIPPENRYYSGSQYMMNLSTLKTYPIKLGTWADAGSVQAGKNLSQSPTEGPTNEDNLFFKAGGTSQWQEFIPNAH